jgi:LPS export ABC transporter permease LptF
MNKLSKYIIKEQLSPFLTGFLFFTFILMLQQIFTLADYIINKNISGLLVLKLFFSMLPISMNLTIPMSVLFSSIMALGRLSGDSEIVALRSAGISIYRIIKPVIYGGFVVFILMTIFNETLLVYCNKNYNKLFLEILKSNPVSLLEDGIFTGIGDKTIWIKKINKKNGKLNDIILLNKNEKSGWDVIKAGHGSLKQNEDGSKTLKLISGKMFSGKPETNSFSIVDFSNGTAELLLSEGKIEYSASDNINPAEMNTLELYHSLKSGIKKNKREIAICRVELYKKLSMPFSCLVFVIIGAPVGISYRRSAKGIGFGISIIILFFYYICLMFGQSLAIRGVVEPFIGVWYPNFILFAAGIVLTTLKEKV